MHPHPILIFILTSLAFTTAQTPQAVRNAVGVTVQDQTFFILGGNDGSTDTDQFMALNLTVLSWPTSDPPWKPLPSLPAGLISSAKQATLINGDSELFFGSRGYNKSIYSLAAQSWSTVSTLPGEYTSIEGVMAVAVPGTTQIVVPTGYIPSGGGYGTLVYDSDSNQFTSAPGMEMADPSGGTPTNIRQYAATWSTERNSVLVYGGSGNNSIVNTKLLEFLPSTRAWLILASATRILETTGDGPGDRQYACLVPAYNGTTLVLFGGYSGTRALNSIYILDVSSMTWTKGKDIDPALGRHSHVCTIAGDSFIAWGGARSNTTVPAAFKEPVVYDLKHGAWTKQFVLNTNMTDPLPGKTNVGAIVGGVMGGLVILLALAFFSYRRYKAAGGTWFKRSKDGTLPEESAPPTDRNVKKDMDTVEHTPVIHACPRPFPPPVFVPVVSAYDPTAIAPPSTQVSPIQAEARSPQFRDSTLDSERRFSKLHPQEYPEGQPFQSKDYFPLQSLPSPPLTMSPIAHFQGYDNSSRMMPVYESPPSTLNWSSHFAGDGDRGQEAVYSPGLLAAAAGEVKGREGSVDEAAAQRLAREILKETQKVQQMELELKIFQSRQNIRQLKDEEEQAQIWSGQQRFNR